MRIPYAEASRGLLRDLVLDAMRDLLLAKDWSSITLADVANAAGISRQTIYNEFGSRQGLAQGYALRLADRLVDAVGEAIYSNVGDIYAAFLSGFRSFFADSAADPLGSDDGMSADGVADAAAAGGLVVVAALVVSASSLQALSVPASSAVAAMAQTRDRAVMVPPGLDERQPSRTGRAVAVIRPGARIGLRRPRQGASAGFPGDAQSLPGPRT